MLDLKDKNDHALVDRYRQWKVRSHKYFNHKYLVCFLTSLPMLKENKELVYGLFEYEYRRLMCVDDIHIITAPDMDMGLQKALKYEDHYDFLVLFRLGNDLKDFFDVLDSKLSPEVGMMGHILDRRNKSAHYEMHDQALLINRKCVEILAEVPYRPEPGNYEVTDIVRSDDNYHDDYTPIWIKAGNQKITVEKPAPGSLWIDTVLKTSSVESFSETTRSHRTYLYPEAQLVGQKALKINYKGEFDPFFSISLEPILVNGAPKFEGPIRNLFSVCSSLRCFLLLNTYGFTNETKLHLFDYSRISLSVMRYLWYEWDGRDYPALSESLRSLAKGTTAKDRQAYWSFFLGEFGGESQWLSTLKRIRAEVDVQFTESNILKDPLLDDYLKTAGDGQGDYLWLSNCFNYKPTAVETRRQLIAESSIRVFRSLRETKPQAMIDAFNPQHCLASMLKAKDIKFCLPLQFENVRDYGETFQFLQRHLNCAPPEESSSDQPETPRAYKVMEFEFPAAKAFEEIKNLDSLFVKHRKDAKNWDSVALHGLAPEKTLSCDRYGYEDENEAPYKWTSAGDMVPTVKNWVTRELVGPNALYDRLYRVRVMRLGPGGYIEAHRDKEPARRGFSALNIAVTNPTDCIMVFEDHGVVPWTPGRCILLDTSYKHSVTNGSSEPRYHLIVHGRFNR